MSVRFRPTRVFREGEGDESGFTCCAFSARNRFLMLGTCSGRLKLYNVFSGEEMVNYACHTSAITHLEPSRVNSHTHANATADPTVGWRFEQTSSSSPSGCFCLN